MSGQEGMAEMPGATMIFEVERTEHQTVMEPDRTISPDAVAVLLTEIGQWVLSRLGRAMEAGHPAQRVTVSVVVWLDGQPAE
jgi:hypothetical protein